MSERYSNTSSRGSAIVVVTVKRSTRRILWTRVGGVRWAADRPARVSRRVLLEQLQRVPELGSMDECPVGRRRSLARSTELAQHFFRLDQVHAFADQRCSAAADAARSRGLALVHPAAQKCPLQLKNVPFLVDFEGVHAG